MTDTTPLVRPPVPTPPADDALPMPEGIAVHLSEAVDIALVNWIHDEDSLDSYRAAQRERRNRAIPLALANAAKDRAKAYEGAYVKAIESGDREGVLNAALGRARALEEVAALTKWTPYVLQGSGPAAARIKSEQDARGELRAWWAVAMLEDNRVPESLKRPFEREAAHVAHLIQRAQDAMSALENRDLDPRQTKAAETALSRPNALLLQARELVQHPIPAQKPYSPRRKTA